MCFPLQFAREDDTQQFQFIDLCACYDLSPLVITSSSYTSESSALSLNTPRFFLLECFKRTLKNSTSSNEELIASSAEKTALAQTCPRYTIVAPWPLATFWKSAQTLITFSSQFAQRNPQDQPDLSNHLVDPKDAFLLSSLGQSVILTHYSHLSIFCLSPIVYTYLSYMLPPVSIIVLKTPFTQLSVC